MSANACGRDLRALIIRAVEEGERYDAVAARFGVHRNTIVKFVRQSRALAATNEEVAAALSQLGVTHVAVRTVRGVHTLVSRAAAPRPLAASEVLGLAGARAVLSLRSSRPGPRRCRARLPPAPAAVRGGS